MVGERGAELFVPFNIAGTVNGAFGGGRNLW